MQQLKLPYFRTGARMAAWLRRTVVVLATSCQIAAGQPGVSTNVPPEVIDQLEKQAADMRVFYAEFSGTEQEPGRQANLMTYYVYFDEGRFYERRHYMIRGAGGQWQPHDHENAFDGKFFFFGDRQENNIETPALLYKYWPTDRTDPDRIKSVAQFPYLDAAGFYAPNRIAEIDSFSGIEPLALRYLKQSKETQVEHVGDNLRITVRVPDPYLLALRETDLEKQIQHLQKSASSPEFKARRIAGWRKLREAIPERIVTFVLDPKRGYGVLEREERTAAGRQFLGVDSQAWQHHSDQDIWLPGKSTINWYTSMDEFDSFTNTPVFTISCELTRIEFGPHTNIQCVLDYNLPGTAVTDRTTPEARTAASHQVGYTAAANGTMLRNNAGSIVAEMSRGQRIFWISVCTIALGVPSVVFLIHRARNSRNRNQ